ncbi:MAG: C-GCAxxG-C-C family protein [Olsenella sp.]|jgi:C_GCAxxG_C_C family probable redox protein|nr:C-GCAxxG-C-C family protein [Olsenella sp.]
MGAAEEMAARATERHERGYNCAQAVACAFAERLGVEEKVLFRATEGLGLGMGGMQGTCGAASGACVVAGLANSTGNLERPDSKASTYAISRRITDRFAHEAGAVRCADLKGVGTGKVVCPCPRCVELGAIIAQEEVFDAR